MIRVLARLIVWAATFMLLVGVVAIGAAAYVAIVLTWWVVPLLGIY